MKITYFIGSETELVEIVGPIVVPGGGGHPPAVVVSPDADNIIEQRPNGIYAAGASLQTEDW